jgi:peptidoglycan hydrolase-like protein with peptidoglycan-binding domain
MAWSAPLSASASITFGQHGPQVEYLQFLLAAGGQSPGRLDGIFGQKTQRALVDAQRALGLEPTGTANLNVLDLLLARPRVSVRVDDVMTPASWVELAVTLGEAYEHVLDRSANRETILALGGILSEEHGANFAAIHDCNLCNHQVRRDERGADGLPRGPWFSLTSREVIARADKMVPSPYPAYATLGEGARGMLIRMRDHHGSVIPFLDRGDGAGAVGAMHDTGWFTGDVEKYKAAVVDRARALAYVT